MKDFLKVQTIIFYGNIFLEIPKNELIRHEFTKNCPKVSYRIVGEIWLPSNIKQDGEDRDRRFEKNNDFMDLLKFQEREIRNISRIIWH